MQDGRIHRRIGFVIVGVVLVGALVGGAVIGFVEHRGGYRPPFGVAVMDASADMAVEALSVHGRTSDVLASYPVTARDLDALGIPYPPWAGGEPRMQLVAVRGSFIAPRVTSTSVPAGLPLTTEIAIQVMDLDNGGPTVTMLTTNQALIDRVLNHLPAVPAMGD